MTIDSTLKQGYKLLENGLLAQCEIMCRGLPVHQRDHPDFLFLLAQLSERQGRVANAGELYERLIERCPNNAHFHLGFAQYLKIQDRADAAERHFRRSITLEPTLLDAKYYLAMLLLSTGRHGEAVAYGQGLVSANKRQSKYWELLAAAHQRSDQLQSAISICERGLSFCPKSPRLSYSLAQLLRERCDFERAALAYQAAKELGFQSPALYQNYSEALNESGRPGTALDVIREGTKIFPGDAHLHRLAARLHVESEADGDPIEFLWASARHKSSNTELWQTLLELLQRQGRSRDVSKAIAEIPLEVAGTHAGIEVIKAGQTFRTSGGSAACEKLEQLALRYPDDSNVLLSFAAMLIQCDDPAGALNICKRILMQNPHDQLALAHLEISLRLMGDSDANWLLDYDSMISVSSLSVPKEYSDSGKFYTELLAALNKLHHARAHPLEQTVRGGTQTNGFLFRYPVPVLQALSRQLQIEVAQNISNFPKAPGHPYWSRAGEQVRLEDVKFAGAWSVSLAGGGFHANHVHPSGWMSAVLYVSVPTSSSNNERHEGDIKFGEPLEELSAKLPPERFIKPEVGTLVLFPSYMWHGTVPFDSAENRITVAFDILPPVD